MNYIEIIIQTDVDSGELLAMLPDSESLGAWESNGQVHLFWPEDSCSNALANVREILSRLGAGEPEITVQSVPDQDWNAAWTASLKPIVLGNRFRVRQSWYEPDPQSGRFEIVIDPKRAFGTGYHATTQLVIEWLEWHIKGGDRVLDVGTGTGILAMAAVRLGAASALAIDNDPVAIECAREYCQANGFGDELVLRTSSFEDLEPDAFDVILANLDIRTLPQFCKHLPRLLKEDGTVCLSGLQPQDLEEVTEALSGTGLKIVGRASREEWLCLSISTIYD